MPKADLTFIALDLCLTIEIDVPVVTALDYSDSIELDYGYDPVGNVTSQTRKDGSAPAVATTYGYDDLHRLVSSASSDGVDNSYAYDRSGNRTQWVTDHAPDTRATLTVNATYDAAGELTKEVKTRPGLLGAPSNTTTNYTYDANGNRTRMQTGSAVTTYSYTADDRLAEVDQGLREVSYEYDGLGRALTGTVWSLLVLQSEAEQVWDGMVVVAQSSAAGNTSLVRDVLGDVALQSTPGLLGSTDTRWGVTDRLGSTIGQAQGSKVGQLAEYSDWGVPTFGTLGWNSETGYTGELGDTTSGLVNFYARSYDPSAGSWLQADPYRGTFDAPETLNRYGYVGGNPTTLTDAYGFIKQQVMRPLERGKAKQYAGPLGEKAGGKGTGKDPRGASDPTKRHGPSKSAIEALLDAMARATGFVEATQNGSLDEFFRFFGMDRDGGIYTTRPDAPQLIAGYMDIYDALFDIGTDMDRGKFEFEYGDDSYVVWVWKGDYVNLGAGAEVGFYTHDGNLEEGNGFWSAVPNANAPDMSLNLSGSGGEIASFDPDQSQAWVGAFNPNVQDHPASQLSVEYTITFPDSGMYDAFRSSEDASEEWEWNSASRTVTIGFRRRKR